VTSVLVVDDDPQLRAAVGRALRLEGFVVAEAVDGPSAIGAVTAGGVDLIVLDQMMPGLDGVGVCRQLRDVGDQTPILMLTARDTVSDRVRGLDSGADDYLVKPFALEELLARIRALLRRQANAVSDVLVAGDLVIDVARRTVMRDDRTIDLTRTEFALLELLARNEGIVLTRDQIMVRVWGYDATLGSNSLDVYVSYVRRKTEEGGLPRLLHTVRGVGYVVRAA
jgi:two-component system, OmpR family, response regulator MprA